MPDNEKQAAFCPNCQQPAIKQGDQIICEKCDATFKITKTGAAKVEQLGRIEKIENDIAEIKSQLPGQEPEPGPSDDEPAATSDESDEKDEDR